MAKKKADAESEAPEATGEAPTMTKSEAMTAAINDGVVKPKEAVEYIKTRFGIDVNTQQFSTHKSLSKKKKGEPTRAKRAPGPKPAAATPSNGKHGDPADLARQVKALVAAYGAGAVKGMVEVFAE
jgi:hypothetical protein